MGRCAMADVNPKYLQERTFGKNRLRRFVQTSSDEKSRGSSVLCLNRAFGYVDVAINHLKVRQAQAVANLCV
jgi:hypothetical protein